MNTPVLITDDSDGKKLKQCFVWLEEHQPEQRPITNGNYRWSFQPKMFDDKGAHYMFFFRDKQDADAFARVFDK